MFLYRLINGKMKSVINLTLTHYIGITYLSFAHKTDGIFSRTEQNVIWKCLKKWMPKESDHGEFAKIMDEVMQWYKNMKNSDNFEEDLQEILLKMNEFEWFTLDRKIESLKDLKTIALADKKFLDSEKKWLRTIGKTWMVDNKTINRIVK
jgi:hypothetical protein